MNSLEKLAALLRGTYEYEPPDEGTARLMQMLQVAGPMVAAQLPDTPEEFDAMLDGVAEFARSLKSDEVPA